MSNQPQTVTAKTAMIFQGDTKEHLLNSAYLLGTLVKESGKDIHVTVFHKDKKEAEAIINHFKIDAKNVTYVDNEKAKTLLDKVKEVAPFCCKNKIHSIIVPNTPADLNNDPKGISELVSHKALDECNRISQEFADNIRAKDEKDRVRIEAEHRVQPSFKFQFIDDQDIWNNREQFGLKEFFPDKAETKRTTF